MYCAYDDDKNIIAIHDKKSIVEKYIENVYMSNRKLLTLGKIKKYSKFKIDKNDELYLVRYADTYIQVGYIDYIAYSSEQLIEDQNLAMDILYRLLEMERLDKKEIKTMKKAIAIMERITKENMEFTPSLSQLKELKMYYEPYIHNTNIIK